MAGRHRIEDAFSAGGAREIGAVICYEGIYIRDRWDDLTRLPWWYRHAPDVARQTAWRQEIIGRLGQDWMVVPVIRPRHERDNAAVGECADGVFVTDRRTGRREALVRESVGGWSAPYAASAVAPDGTLPRSREEIDALVPLPEPVGVAEITRTGQDDLARALLRGFGADLFPIYHVTAPLWATYGLLGFEAMMVMVADSPDLIEHACKRLLASAIRGVHVAAALGAAGVWIEDCMTDMVGPRAFQRLNVPYVRAIANEVRASGMRSIHYFCGNPAGKWDYLLSTGADALALEESKKGFSIDIEDVVDRVGGRIAVLGNLDAIGLLEHGSEEELRAGIGRQIRAGRRNGSRFVMSIGSPVTPGTSPKRVRLYIDLAHELGSR